jgi:RNA polymerase sigma factor (sigma-70 family)
VGVSDVVQSVCCVVHARRNQFRGSNDQQFRGWLLTIAEHKIIDSLRRYRRRQCPTEHRLTVAAIIPHVAVETTAEDLASLTEQAHLLLTSLGNLPADIRDVVLLRYTRKMTFPEIAAELKSTESTCRRRWFEGLETLGRRLGGLAE